MNGERRIPGRFAGSLGSALAFPLLAALLAGCSLPHAPSPATAPAVAAADDVPYQLRLEAVGAGSNLKGLHSVAHAVYRDKGKTWLVIVAGRTNGMHAFPEQGAGSIWSFPPSKANDLVYVVDLDGIAGPLAANDAVTSLQVKCPEGAQPGDCLPPRIIHQLMATNTQSFVDGRLFYIVGGYGLTEDGNSMRTFDQVLTIDLPNLVTEVNNAKKFGLTVLNRTFAKKSMRTGDHPALAITGGDIVDLGDETLLVFGQLFNGLYTENASVAQQEYSQAVRRFMFQLSGTKDKDGIGGVDVSYLGKCPDPDPVKEQPIPDGPYHRRDFTLSWVLAPDGSPRVGVFGGVFKGGRMEGYVHPVYITQGTPPCSGKGTDGFTLAEDGQSSQLLSQYDSVIVPLHSASRKAMYTTSFGGISQYYWDGHALKQDKVDRSATPRVDGLPFINSISTLRVGGLGNGDFLHQDAQGAALTFPPAGQEPLCGTRTAPYLGTNSWFVMANDLPLNHGVILLDKITKETVIGYIFGGIASTKNYPGPATCASDRIYKVTLDPTRATRTVRLEPPG